MASERTPIGETGQNSENRKAMADLASLAEQLQPCPDKLQSEFEHDASSSETGTKSDQQSSESSRNPFTSELMELATFPNGNLQENTTLTPSHNFTTPRTRHDTNRTNENQILSCFPADSSSDCHISDSYFKRRSLSVVDCGPPPLTRHRSSTQFFSTSHYESSSSAQNSKKDHSIPEYSINAILAFQEEIEQRIMDKDETPLSVEFLKQYRIWFDLDLKQRQTCTIGEALRNLKETIKRYTTMYELILEQDEFDAQTASFIKTFSQMDSSHCLHHSIKDPILKALKNAIENKNRDLPDNFVSVYLIPLHKLLIPGNTHERSQDFVTMASYSHKLYLACSSFLSLSLIFPLYEDPVIKSTALSTKKVMDGVSRATTQLLEPNFRRRCSIHDAIEKLEMISILFENYSEKEIMTINRVLKLENYRREWLDKLMNKWNSKVRLLPSFHQLYFARITSAHLISEALLKKRVVEEESITLEHFKTIFPVNLAPRSLSADTLEQIALIVLDLDPLFRRYLQSDMQRLFPALIPYDGHPLLYELSKSILPAVSRMEAIKNFLQTAIERVDNFESPSWQFSIPHLDEATQDAHWLQELSSKSKINQFLSNEYHDEFNLCSNFTEPRPSLASVDVTVSTFLRDVRLMSRCMMTLNDEKKASLLQLFSQLDRLFPEHFTFGDQLNDLLQNQCEMLIPDGIDEIGKLSSLVSRLPECLRIFEASRTFNGLHLNEIIRFTASTFLLLADKLHRDLDSFEPASLKMDGQHLLEILAAMESLISIDGCKASTDKFAGLRFLAIDARNTLQKAIHSLKSHFENVLQQMNKMLQVHSFKDAFFLKEKMSRLLPFIRADGFPLFRSVALLLHGQIPMQSQYEEACIDALHKLFSEVHFKLNYPKTPRMIHEELTRTEYIYDGIPVQDWYMFLLARRELYLRFWATQFNPTFRVAKVPNYDPTVPLIQQLKFNGEPIGIGVPTFIESSKGVWFLREPLWVTPPLLLPTSFPSLAGFSRLPSALRLHQAIIVFPCLASELKSIQSQLRHTCLIDRSPLPDSLRLMLSSDPRYGTGSAQMALKYYPSPCIKQWPESSIDFLDSLELQPPWVPIERSSPFKKWVIAIFWTVSLACAIVGLIHFYPKMAEWWIFWSSSLIWILGLFGGGSLPVCASWS